MKRLIIIVLALVAIILYCSKQYWRPYYNEYYINHAYEPAPKNKPFIIAIEPRHAKHLELSVFVRNLLKATFSDYDVVFDSSASNPNLIVRSEAILSKEAKINADVIVPYITISGEPKSIKVTRYKWYGLPLAELISTTPAQEHEMYFPFIGWSEVKTSTQRQSNLKTATKSVLYVSSNCIAEREELFSLLKQKKALIVDALGKCSNPSNKKAGGGYKDLNTLYSEYQFVFAMENCQKSGYITEKIVNVFNSGAIPIYWGDTPTVNNLFNKEAFINVADFKSLAEAADYIEQLAKDPVHLQHMHTQPILNFNIKSDLLELDSESNPYVLEQAKKLRSLYEKYLVKHKKV